MPRGPPRRSSISARGTLPHQGPASTGSSGTLQREETAAKSENCRQFSTIVTSVGGVHRYSGAICKQSGGPAIVQLDEALTSVVGVKTIIPADAFTAETLGTERAGHGVMIRNDGLVLTIGMAVDTNVIIYERIKEELTRGKGYIPAINEGYRRSLPPVLDGHMTVLMTAIILFYFGLHYIIFRS